MNNFIFIDSTYTIRRFLANNEMLKRWLRIKRSNVHKIF